MVVLVVEVVSVVVGVVTASVVSVVVDPVVESVSFDEVIAVALAVVVVFDVQLSEAEVVI